MGSDHHRLQQRVSRREGENRRMPEVSGAPLLVEAILRRERWISGLHGQRPTDEAERPCAALRERSCDVPLLRTELHREEGKAEQAPRTPWT